MPRLTTLTMTSPATWAGMLGMSRLIPLVTGKRAGAVPAGALDDVAGLASPEDATAVVLLWIRAGVTVLELTTPFTVTVPLVNGLVLFVHDTLCPLGAPHTHPTPDAPTGRTP